MFYVSLRSQMIAGVDHEAGEVIDDKVIDAVPRLAVLINARRIGLSTDPKVKRRFGDKLKPPKSATKKSLPKPAPKPTKKPPKQGE